MKHARARSSLGPITSKLKPRYAVRPGGTRACGDQLYHVVDRGETGTIRTERAPNVLADPGLGMYYGDAKRECAERNSIEDERRRHAGWIE